MRLKKGAGNGSLFVLSFDKQDSPYSASSPFSSVRIRMASSTEVTNSLPSPILPVLAALVMEREERYARYVEYEEKVRRAVECERRIRELEALGFMTEVTKLRFRLMQLTGLDDIEEILTRLLAEAR